MCVCVYVCLCVSESENSIVPQLGLLEVCTEHFELFQFTIRELVLLRSIPGRLVAGGNRVVRDELMYAIIHTMM